MFKALVRIFAFVGFAAIAAILGLAYFGMTGSVLPPAEKAVPPLINFEDLDYDPWKYDGKTIRVRGFFDECKSRTCSICSTQEAHKNVDRDDICLGVFFDVPNYFPDQKSKMSELDYSIRSRGADESEKLAEFSEITIEADFDAACSGVREGTKRGDPAPPSTPGVLDEIIVCTGRQTQLEYAQIVKIHRWFLPRGFTNLFYSSGDLAKAPAAEVTKIRAAFEASLYPGYEVSELDDLDSYTFVMYPEDAKGNVSETFEEGGICWCRLDECADSVWPLMEAHARDRLANPYECYWAQSVDGQWRFYLQ